MKLTNREQLVRELFCTTDLYPDFPVGLHQAFVSGSAIQLDLGDRWTNNLKIASGFRGVDLQAIAEVHVDGLITFEFRKHSELDQSEENHEKLQKPELGLMPKDFFYEHVAKERFTAVCEAIKRFYDTNQKIPIDWIEEYNELIQTFEDNNIEIKTI